MASKVSQETNQLMQGLAAGIDELLNQQRRPKRNGFVLLVFPFGAEEGKRCNYVSNAERKDIISLLKEMTARFEGQPEQSGRA